MSAVRVHFQDGTWEDIGPRYQSIVLPDSGESGEFTAMTYATTSDEWLIVYENYETGLAGLNLRTARIEVARFRPWAWRRVQLI